MHKWCNTIFSSTDNSKARYQSLLVKKNHTLKLFIKVKSHFPRSIHWLHDLLHYQSVSSRSKSFLYNAKGIDEKWVLRSSNFPTCPLYVYHFPFNISPYHSSVAVPHQFKTEQVKHKREQSRRRYSYAYWTVCSRSHAPWPDGGMTWKPCSWLTHKTQHSQVHWFIKVVRRVFTYQ